MERLPPQNIEAEAAVLGSILIDPQALSVVAELLHAEDFYRDGHRVLFQAALDLYSHGQPADLVTLTDAIERQGKLEQIGGADYITMLVNVVPTSANVEYYAQIVARTSILRKLIHAAGQIAALAYTAEDATVALDKAEQLIFAISQNVQRADFEHIRDILNAYYDKLDHLHNHRGDIVGVPTGFSDLDKMTGGLQRSDLIILAARPSVGKTSFALSLAHNAAVKFGASLALFSLEMSKEQLAQRLLSMDAGIDQQRLRTGYISDADDEWARISVSMGRLSESNIYIDDTAGITMIEMRSKARRLMAERGFDVLMVDYLQLMQGTGSKGDGNRQQEISEISRGLKGLARELNVPVLALSQLSRAVENRQSKVPQLSDLRESGCLTGDTLVYLPDSGRYERIGSLVGRSGFNVLALNTDTWKVEPRPVTRAFSTGCKPIFRMTTRLGRTIRATANHKFLTINGWQRLDELAPDMRIAVPRMLPGPTEQTMTDAELALLGHLIGDGCTLPRQPIHYTTNDMTLAEIVADLAVQVFGAAVTPRINRERTWYQVYLAATEHLGPGKRSPVVLWLEDLGVYGLRSYEQKAAMTTREMQASLGMQYCGTTLYKSNLSRNRAAAVATIVQSPELANLAQSDVYWDKIVSIEPEGEEEVYDLTVEDLHNFVAHNIFTHNSIEQDSDIVMFIYRDEIYNPETDRPNIADIIVAKHRNGPVGTISLYFQPNQTRFRDLELQRVEDL
jgi:replicative DNA helicase